MVEACYDELPDNISVCSECGRHVCDDTETKWSEDADPYCPECFEKLTKRFKIQAKRKPSIKGLRK